MLDIAVLPYLTDTPWNTKGRCGPHFIGDDKKTWPAECNPDIRYHCCRMGWNNTEGYCGVDIAHFCKCDNCIDYRRDNYTLSKFIMNQQNFFGSQITCSWYQMKLGMFFYNNHYYMDLTWISQYIMVVLLNTSLFFIFLGYQIFTLEVSCFIQNC